MTVYHDEIEIEDFEYDEEDEVYYYPCPCGDRFQISKVSKLNLTPKYFQSNLRKNYSLVKK